MFQDKYEELRKEVDEEIDKLCEKHNISTSIRSYYAGAVKSIQFNIRRNDKTNVFDLSFKGFYGYNHHFSSDEVQEISEIMKDFIPLFPKEKKE